MSRFDDYKHAMDMVKEVERGPVLKFSAETRCFADLVRAVDFYHLETRKRADRVQAEDSGRRCEVNLSEYVGGLIRDATAFESWYRVRFGQDEMNRADWLEQFLNFLEDHNDAR